MVTFGFVALNLSLIPAMAFLNASALDPEFQAMTLIVTGAPPPLAAGWAAAGALVGAPAAAGLAGALVGAGVDADCPHAASTTAPAPSAIEPSRRRRLNLMTNLPRFPLWPDVSTSSAPQASRMDGTPQPNCSWGM